MKNNPLKELEKLGQSVWLDYIRRDLITSGELKRLINNDGLKGMTSNPTIFEKAFAGTPDYDEDIRSLARAGQDVNAIYEYISTSDVRNAADEFRGVYDRTQGGDGYVSLEVSPYLAQDTMGTIKEARRLWQTLNRPNVFIKVPATAQGVPAIRELTGDGININVTLLFGLDRYREVAEAYIAGLEMLADKSKSVSHVASVASFFVSRVDTLLDPWLQERKAPPQLKGQAAIANARAAYQIYKEIFLGERFKKLADKGARPQRLLWASTSTKNPDYSDVKYVEALIGPNTVNTMPLETFKAYRDHGRPQARIEENLPQVKDVFKQLNQLGIDMNNVARQLESQGVEQFEKPFTQLLKSLEQKEKETCKSA